MKKLLSSFLGLLCIAAYAQTTTIGLNEGWHFVKSDVQLPDLSRPAAGDTILNLPHTWNALDGQDGGNNYYRGAGWYSRELAVPADFGPGKTAYLNFSAANMKTDVFIDGTPAGTHTGGYARFMFDITDFLTPGQTHRLDIRVDNSPSIVAPPLGGDFTFFGGITRDLTLDIKPALHISPLNRVDANPHMQTGVDVASSGVRIFTTDVSPESAEVTVRTQWRNASTSDAPDAKLRFTIADADGIAVLSETVAVPMAAGHTGETEKTLTMTRPHLWDGIKDPYIYTVNVELLNGSEVTDKVAQPLGVRFFEMSKTEGFKLNGKSYPLRGIAIHDAVKDKGRAVSDADRKADIDLMLETGANFLRLAHYQHGDFTYHYLDSLGIICWTEIPVVEGVSDTDEFKQSCAQQLYELIHQLQNHPSVICWGLCNEIRQMSGSNHKAIVETLNEIAHAEDSTRPTTLAHNGWYEENTVPDIVSINVYQGWYNNTATNFGATMDTHNGRSSQPVGVSEYGAGCNPWQHEYPTSKPTTTGPWHPEEYANQLHEIHLAQINTRPYLWQTSIWVGIDFASDHRDEGEQPGINDKGLVTFDRNTKKDVFYLYKAAWNQEEPTLHIAGRRYNLHESTRVPVRVYTNCPEVTLIVNGKEIGTRSANDFVAAWDSVEMLEGKNSIQAKGIFNGSEISDEVIWSCMLPTGSEVAAALDPEEQEKKEYIASIQPAPDTTAESLDEILITVTSWGQSGENPVVITDSEGQTVFSGKLTEPGSDRSARLYLRPGITASGTYTLHFVPGSIRVGGIANTVPFSVKFVVKNHADTIAYRVPVYLVAGQSNTDGRARVDTYPKEIRDYLDSDTKNCFWSYCNGSESAWERFGGHFSRYKNYTDRSNNALCGFDGVLYKFIDDDFGKPFYVVKESKGGTAIDPACTSVGDLWWSADAEWLASHGPRAGGSLTNEFTDNLAALIDGPLAALPAGYEIKCIVWHQGCSDLPQAERYHDNLLTLVNHLRSFIAGKTNDDKYLTLPFIAGSISPASTQYSSVIEEAKAALATEDVNFHYVNLDDCALGSDSLHFSAEGNIEAARRIYQAIQAIESCD